MFTFTAVRVIYLLGWSVVWIKRCHIWKVPGSFQNLGGAPRMLNPFPVSPCGPDSLRSPDTPTPPHPQGTEPISQGYPISTLQRRDFTFSLALYSSLQKRRGLYPSGFYRATEYIVIFSKYVYISRKRLITKYWLM